MSDDPKLTGDQLKRIIKDAHSQDKADQAEAEMSDAEIEARMKAEGLTDEVAQQSLARQRAKFEAARDREQNKKKVVRWRWRGTPASYGVTVLVAAAACFALIVGLARSGTIPVEALFGPQPTVTVPFVVGATEADDYRDRAAYALKMDRYKLCLTLLEAAKDLDPAGDAKPDVAALRQQATAALAKQRRP